MSGGLSEILNRRCTIGSCRSDRLCQFCEKEHSAILALVPEKVALSPDSTRADIYRSGFNQAIDQILKNFGEPQ